MIIVIAVMILSIYFVSFEKLTDIEGVFEKSRDGGGWNAGSIAVFRQG